MTNSVLKVWIDESGTKVVLDIEEPGINAVSITMTPASAVNLANVLVGTVRVIAKAKGETK